MIADRVRLLFLASAAFALVPGTTVPRAQTQAPPPVRDVAPAAPDVARDFSQDVPAHLSYIDGEVTLERNGRFEPAETNATLLAGDRLRTRGGRVEVLYPDGSTLHIDRDTELDLLSDQILRLLGGTLRVTVPHAPDDFELRVDAPAAFVEIRVAGEYRIDTGVDQHGDPDVALTVVRGSAELVNGLGRTRVRPGRQAVANAKELPSEAYAVNLANLDEFDRWSDDRRTAHVATESAAYLPEAVEPYSSVMDDYGTWTTEPVYGAVWYPRVAAAWHPYSQGRWNYSGYYGWTWVGIDPWAWPTHHYGRWGYNDARWFWIPGQAWSPAWVSWGYAPGYVSWCPLGYNNRAVIGWTAIGTQTVSAFRVYDPFAAWTVVPSSQFVPNLWVTEHAVTRNVVQPVRDSFVERPSAPQGPRMASARDVAQPLRAPTRTQTAVARSQTSAGPFESARVPSRGGSAPPRDQIRSTIIGTPRDAAPTIDRRVDRGDTAIGSGGNPKGPVIVRPAPASGQASRPDDAVRRAAPSSIDVPRADENRATPSRAVPRAADPVTYSAPVRAADPRASSHQVPVDRTPAQGAEPAPRQGNSSVVGRTPPPATAQPAQPSQAAPSRHSAEQPAARTSSPPPSAPPSAAPPPARGGGSAGRGSSDGGAAAAPPPQATSRTGRGGS